MGTLLGTVVGTLVGWRLVTVEHARATVETQWLVITSTVGLLSLLDALLVVSVGNVGYEPFWPGIAGLGLAIGGWVGILQIGQAADSRAAVERAGDVVTLPPTDRVGGLPGLGGDGGVVRRGLDPLVALAIVVLGGLTVLEREPLLGVFALPGLVYLIPFSTRPHRITEDGLIFDQRLGTWRFGAKRVDWDAFAGYRVEADRLVIVDDTWWHDRSYDCGAIDDFEAVTAALDRHLVRLEWAE